MYGAADTVGDSTVDQECRCITTCNTKVNLFLVAEVEGGKEKSHDIISYMQKNKFTVSHAKQTKTTLREADVFQ